MAESCIWVGYIILLFKAGCLSIHVVLFFFSVLYVMARYVFPMLLGKQAVVSDSFMPECFTDSSLFNSIWDCLSAGLQHLTCSWRSFYTLSSICWPASAEARSCFLGLLSRRWIFHCFGLSIFGWSHTPKTLLGEWAEGRDAALSHLKIKSFIIKMVHVVSNC